jgi:hypothetical protein
MKFGSTINMLQNELQNARVQNLASAPGSPVSGQFYYDTTLNQLRWWNGTVWVNASGSATLFYQTFKDNATARTQRSATNVVSTTSIVLAATDNAGADSTDITATTQFGAISPQTTFAGSSANGVANTSARSDHTHGTPTHDAAAHGAIPLSALAAPTAAVSLNSQKITNLLDGTAATDAVNLGQVQNLIATDTNKTSVRFATTANGTLATAFANGQVHDGVTAVTGDRFLMRAQTTGTENGIYIVNASGAPTRATDADISAEVKGGLSVWVNEGTTQGDTRWVLTTNDPIVLGTTALTFVQDFAANATTAGAGLTATGNSLNVGAGTGITVAADSVSVDTTIVARFKTFTITGNSATTSFTLPHNLNNDFPLIQVWDTTASPNEVWTVDIKRTDANNHVVVFAVAPTTGQNYKATVNG